jgi:hypothetical protein
MKNFKRIASIVMLAMFCCVLKPVSANAQDIVSPPIVVGVSINESEPIVIYNDWPMLVDVVIFNENAYQKNVPVILSPAWKNSLHFVIRNFQGEIVSWPFHIVSTANADIVLDSLFYAEVGYWLEPNETNQISPGQYELPAILDSSAYPGLGSNVLSAGSGPLEIHISDEPGSLTLEQKTDKDILFANLNLIKEDNKKALEYLSGILEYNPTDLGALSMTGYILESEGDYGGALYAYSRALEICYSVDPTPDTPPVELLRAQNALYYKLDTSASFVVTLSAKDTTHPLYQQGSPLTYYVDNIPARELRLMRGKTYTFYMKDIPTDDPLYFSTNVKGGGLEPYTESVSGTPAVSNGTATITVSENTPKVLYYQSSKNEYVGWRMDIIDNNIVTSVPENNVTHFKGYSLSVAYPNPFNSSTCIQYTIPKASTVRITVYDIRGKQVAILVDEKKEAGSYQVEWNPQLPSGVYSYRIQAGEFRDSKKMLLLR